ncbi:MAG: ABC transporter substrate-binding protein [Candidatus Tectimicrobiota bacterium]
MQQPVPPHRQPGFLHSVVLLALWACLILAPPGETQTPSYRIGLLISGFTSHPALTGFRDGLAQLGYTEGHNLHFLLANAEGEAARLPDLATGLVAAAPDVIFTIGTMATTAAKHATTTVPIVFAFVADPIQAGLVASHASSRNNVTGISNHAGALMGKRLEFLKEVLPEVKRVLTIVTPREDLSLRVFDTIANVAPQLGIELVRRDVSSAAELAPLLQALPAGTVEAILYVPSTLLWSQMEVLIEQAHALRLPLIGHDNSTVEQGALLSYGADFRLLGQQAARLAVKMLHGAKPAEIPIQTPERLFLAVNLSTARALGLKIPRHVLENTDLLIE